MVQFDPAAATAAYLAVLSPAQHAKAQAYTQGGHWLLLWSAIISVTVAWLVLRSGLDDWVPAGSRVIRLVRCRLDHDAIDLYWHSPTLLEITLTARQLPEPRGNDRQTYEGE